VIRTSSPTVWRRWLAFEMRRLRQRAGLSQGEIAKVLGSQVPKISLMEKGRRHVQRRDLEKLLPLFEVSQDRWDNYFAAAEKAHKKGWWEIDREHTIPGWLQHYIGLEQGAQRLRTYHPAIFPGLLQTPEYAAAILHYLWISRSEAAIEQMVEVRMRRQHAIRRDDDPVRLWTIVDEAALRRMVGRREIMRAQLEHVAAEVERYDHVRLQIMPFDRPGAYEAAYGAFTILTFGWLTDPGVVYLERPWDAQFLESLAATDEYSTLFRRLSDLALSPDKSTEMLHRCALEWAA
jgi:transcriptional regulator with XRE-family HTH domain